MDRLNAIKQFATSFSLTLHAANLLLWKKILSFTLFKVLTVSRPSTLLKVFLMRRLGCATKGGNWRGSPYKPKSLFICIYIYIIFIYINIYDIHDIYDIYDIYIHIYIYIYIIYVNIYNICSLINNVSCKCSVLWHKVKKEKER